MRRNLKVIATSTLLVAGLLGASAVLADRRGGSGVPQSPMMGSGMMGRGNMMGMIGQIGPMIETCNRMMQAIMDHQAPQRLNEQLQEPENKG